MGQAIQDRIRARDSAVRLLNRLTTAVAFTAVGGVALLSVVSAHTAPGTATTTGASGSTSSPGSAASTSPGTSASGFQQSTTPVSSSASRGVAVSGGS
jgi:hypothetical protein